LAHPVAVAVAEEAEIRDPDRLLRGHSDWANHIGRNPAMNVIIVGGGIAGLTMALSLHQAGIRARVYEAAKEVRPLGVGINLQPTAVRELTELGLAEQLGHAGIAINALSLFNKHGQLICSEQRGLSAGYRWPQYAIHRGRLQLLLWRAAQERLGTDNVRSGLEFIHFSQCDARVIAPFRDRASGMTVTEEADVLVGADGIHSAIPRFADSSTLRKASHASVDRSCGALRSARNGSSAATVRPFVGTSSNG
jgi:2-polyprenyl-6-methoxyphenol hydroxylase-like FAD-dependent oxidoreductase